MLIQQAHEDDRGARSPIPQWVERFTDGSPQHIALKVTKLEDSVRALADAGVRFIGQIAGDEDSEFRTIYAEPDLVDGVPHTVLELIERHWGFTGFLSMQSLETLMRSSEA